jgi:hypothetical protein
MVNLQITQRALEQCLPVMDILGLLDHLLANTLISGALPP